MSPTESTGASAEATPSRSERQHQARRIVRGNAAVRDLTAGVAEELTAAPVNVPRLLLHPQGLAPRIANLDLWAGHIIDALRGKRRVLATTASMSS